jgi:hypothetical protein
MRTALTEIEQAANRISPLLVYILEVTRGRYFAPKYSFLKQNGAPHVVEA